MNFQAILIKYIKGIYDFESYINNNKNQYSTTFNESFGYLINYEDYEELKIKINYQKNLKVYKPYFSNPINSNTTKYYTLEEIKFKDSKYLLNMLFNGNKYIIINENFWKLICPENKENIPPIKFKINYYQIQFKLDDNKELIFDNTKDNIISNFYSSDNPEYLYYLSNFNYIVKNIYEKIDEYYNFEFDFLCKLKKFNKQNFSSGYLIDFDWFKKWMNSFYYLDIKSNYLEKKKSKKEVIDFLICLKQLNKIPAIPFEEPKIYKFNSNEEFYSIAKEKKLIMVNTSLILSSRDYSHKITLYYIYNNKIEFDFSFQQPLILEIKNNLITFKNENKEEFPNYLQIAKIFCFRKFLKNEMQKKFPAQIKSNSAIFIKKKIINEYISKFNYETILKIINETTTYIDYKNMDKKFKDIIDYLKTHDKKSYEEISKKEKLAISLNFFGNSYNLVPQIDEFQGVRLTFISEFEIIDEDIYYFFKENNIIHENQIIKGEFIASDEKFFLSYNSNNSNFFEIVRFNDTEDRFIIEYIIEENFIDKNNIIRNFQNLGIKRMIEKINKDIIFCTNLTFHCYKINKNEGQNQNFNTNYNDSDNQYKINDIISALMSLIIFEKDIIKKLDKSMTQITNITKNIGLNHFSTMNCKLINGNFLADIKKVFKYEKIIEIMKKYQIISYNDINDEKIEKYLKSDVSYFNYLIGSKNDFCSLKEKAKEFISIDKKPAEKDGDKFYYPINFNLINDNIFDKFVDIFDLKGKIKTEKPEEILANYNFGNIAFKGLNDNFLGNNMYLLYIYSMKASSELYNINFHPEAILDFQTYANLFNGFSNIMSKNILDKINNSPNYLVQNYHCKICLIFNQSEQIDNASKINDSDLYNDDKNEYFNKLIDFSISFYFKFKKFYDSFKIFPPKPEEKLYLINKKYIDEIKLISHFEEINDAIIKNPKIKAYFDSNYENYFSELKQSLDKKILIKFFLSQKLDIQQKLKKQNLFDKSPKHLYDDPANNLIYYENFQFINQEIYDLLFQLDNHFYEKYLGGKFLFSDNKVISFLNDNENCVINIGKKNATEEFEFEFLIQSENKFNIEFDLKNLFNIIKDKGYSAFKRKFIEQDKIQISLGNNMIIKARVYKLSSMENIINYDDTSDQNDNQISEKIKAMILFVISQINFEKVHEYTQQNIEKVYLMNYNNLLEYKYEEIFSLINENKDIKNLVEEINRSSYPYDSNIFDQIISKLNNGKLREIDNELQKTDLSYKNLEAKLDLIKLKNKNIKICKEFILVTEKIFKEIRANLSLNFSPKYFYYTYNDGDIIASNKDSQYFILFGNINNESHLFNLRYILDFDHGSYLNTELNTIKQFGIEFYMKEKTIFSEGNNKDLISPIFSEEKELGYFYKYSPGINYQDGKGEEYSNYLYRGNFYKIMKLYNYYNDFRIFSEKDFNGYEKGYYLINKDVMNAIKKDYNYEIILETMNKAKFQTKNEKQKMLFILKNLPEDIYEDFIKDSKPIEMRLKDYAAPTQITFTIPEPPNDAVNLYKNFELIDSSTAKLFIGGIYGQEYDYYNKSDKNFVECAFREGKIILYFPKNKLNNDKYVYEIGKINEDNTFIPEYLIIYMNDNSHFSSIKYNLNKYLESIENQFVNGIYPITRNPSYWNDFEELGKIIDLKKIKGQNIFETDIQQGGTMDINYGYGNQDYNEFSNQGEDKDKKNKKKPITTVPKAKYSLKEYNLDEQTINRDIKNNYSMPPLIGLDNIGATCYMNATLQCLCNIPKFVNYFKYNNHLKEKVRNDVIAGNKLLCSSFKLLIEQLWPDRLYYNNYNNPNFNYPSFGNIGSNNTFLNKKNESFPPKDFKAKISRMNDLFKGVAANDAKDLVNFLIMTLHEELNTAEKKILNTSAINQDQRNQQLMFNLFTQDFVNNNKSIISDLFYGVNYNIVQCNGCMTRSFNYQTYFFFVFPLEEIRIFKNQNNYNNNFNYNMNFNNNEVNIYDCFLYDQRINYMVGENAMFCNFCKRQCNSQMCTILAFGPEIIIIILNRGQGIQYKVKLNFDEQLNLYNFIEYKDTGVNYQLIGVVTHLGGSDMSGHFIAYCKNPISNTWYQYNDSIVNEVNQSNFKAEVIDFAMPYLLFYQKIGK